MVKSTNIFLTCGSLHEMEIAQAYADAKVAHKHKLIAQRSLGRGGLLLARDVLQKIKEKRRQEADNKLWKVNRAITLVENKAKNELHIRGV
jgi:hypothetical protein